MEPAFDAGCESLKTGRSDTLSLASNNTYLSAYSRSSTSQVDQISISIINTRSKVVHLIKTRGHMMSFEDRREVEWDLWFLHGILEFGFTVESMQ